MNLANFIQTASRPVILKVLRLRVALPLLSPPLAQVVTPLLEMLLATLLATVTPLLETLLATVTPVQVVTPLPVLLPRALLPVPLPLPPLLPPLVARRARVKTTRCLFKTLAGK